MVLMLVCLVFVTGTSTTHIPGRNILVGKAARSSPTVKNYPASYAIDGNYKRACLIRKTNKPYWQIDLLGFHLIYSITVTNAVGGWAWTLRNASIGVSANKRDMTVCGKFPTKKRRTNETFYCPGSGNVRLVKVWKKTRGAVLSLAEITVDGIKTGIIAESKFVHCSLVQVTRTTMETSAKSYLHCAATCCMHSSCLAFSFSLFHSPNCQLSCEIGTKENLNWTGCTVSLN